jgi:hypothetical protein
MAAKSRTALFYQSHPKSRRKHVRDQAEINKRPAEVQKRVELNAYNRKHPSKKDDDASHKYDKATGKMRIVGFSKASRNRGDKNNGPGDKRARGRKS